MVALEIVRASNARISTLPSGLVAVFVGATNGVGETTLRQFAQHASKPRVYFVGRSQEAGNRIAGECKALNPTGEFIFLQKETSTIASVDEVCAEIKGKEKAINLLFLTIATLQPGISKFFFPLSFCRN
jgi:NADP-dependent 3-hydroxy acid dehydrogenase YdfG